MIATTADLLRAYPAIPNVLLFDFAGSEEKWDRVRKWLASGEETVEDNLEWTRQAVVKSRNYSDAEKAEILAEMQTSDFRRYVAGRLGAM